MCFGVFPGTFPGFCRERGCLLAWAFSLLLVSVEKGRMLGFHRHDDDCRAAGLGKLGDMGFERGLS